MPGLDQIQRYVHERAPAARRARRDARVRREARRLYSVPTLPRPRFSVDLSPSGVDCELPHGFFGDPHRFARELAGLKP